jgi:hypothetical protein
MRSNRCCASVIGAASPVTGRRHVNGVRARATLHRSDWLMPSVPSAWHATRQTPAPAHRLRSTWGCRRYRRHAQHDMTLIISSTGSCYVTPGKHRLLQYFRASPVSIAWHDPAAERSSLDSWEGGSEEQICPRIGQSVRVIGQDKAFLILFVLSREHCSLMSGIRPSF